jgi:hypothetical protein
MIVVPSSTSTPETRLYRDSVDPKVAYLDLRRAKPVRGTEAVRWLPVSPQDAYLMGEVRFGPDAGEFEQVPGLAPNTRVLPMPWDAGPVWAWGRDGDRARLIAKGATSGFGMANAVLNGTAPLGAVGAPVMIAAELTCRAQLAGVRLSGSGQPSAADGVAAQARVGRRAEWSATVADALLVALEEAERTGLLALAVEPTASSSEAAEVRWLGLLEWARRVGAAATPPVESLAMPAARVARLQLAALPDFRIDWPPGTVVSFRAIRVLNPGGLNAPVLEVRPDGAPAQAGPA